MSFTAIILAGGFGTRLQKVVNDIPKPMAPVRNRPFLDYQLEWLQKYGCTKVLFCTGHLAGRVSGHYGDRFGNIAITYSVESKPLGTGGAIKLAMEKIRAAESLVINGDSMFDIDLDDFRHSHSQLGSVCSLALRKVENASRYGSISTDEGRRITAFREKSKENEPGLINGGIYLLNRKTFLDRAPMADQFSMEKDFFAAQCDTLPMYGFLYDAYFIDIGVPEDYERAQHEFERFEDR